MPLLRHARAGQAWAFGGRTVVRRPHRGFEPYDGAFNAEAARGPEEREM